MSQQPADYLGWALHYASLGWKIFPLSPKTKMPLAGSHGSSEATDDVEQIKAWWAAHPTANIGMNPKLSGLYVFDMDPRNGGEEGLAHLQQMHGALDSPLRSISGRGVGFHQYFAADPGASYLGRPAKGCDGKHNGFVVLPPSLHPETNRHYAWAPDCHPVPACWLPTAPDYLRKQIHERKNFTPREVSPAELPSIVEALSYLDPEDNDTWVNAMASLKHWGDHAECEAEAFEAFCTWSAGSTNPKHAGNEWEIEKRWNSWNSFSAHGRTIASVFHEAKDKGYKQGVDAKTAFDLAFQAMGGFNLPEREPVRAVEWTTEPVAVFSDTSSPADMLTGMLAKGDSNFARAWNDGAAAETLVGSLAWRTGGNCEQVRQILELRKDIVETPELKQAIMTACAKQQTFYGVDGLDAQKLVGIDLERQDFAQAEAVICGLLPEMLNVFKRDNSLVWVNSTGQIVTYGVSRLSSKIETYVKLSKGKKLFGVSLPDALANRVLSRQDYPELGELKAAIQYPTARADGSVITQHGLDAATGLYLARQSDYQPRALDRQGLIEALARVWAPFKEFPYDGPVSAATMLAALLTCVCRVSIETAPAFLISAQAPGTGKSKLCECLMLVAGESKTSVNFPSEPAEQEKTLTAMLLRAPRGMYFDNLKGYLKDTSSFCMAMTSSQYRARMLGGLNSLEISNRALWVLNGNNVVVTGDAVRRVLTVGLDSPENPGERQFDFDPVELIEADPERYRRDLLDVLHTYAAAGRPRQGMGGYASFDVWNALVRGCVLWLEREGVTPCLMQDPMESIRRAREDDPETQKRELLVAAWAEKFGSEPVFLRDVPPTDCKFPMWGDAYATVCERKGRIDHSNLSYYLRTIKGRKTDGLAFVAGEKTRQGVPWSLLKIS